MIDIEKMKQKLANLENKTSFRKNDDKKNDWFKPQAGDQIVRFLPSPDGDPFKEFWFHYDMGPSFLCPYMNFNDKCPACLMRIRLRKEGTDESKKMAEKFKVKQRFLSNIVERKDDATPKHYAFGKEAYKSLILLTVDPDYGDITDIEEGNDFTLNYTLPKKKGAFPETKLTPKPKKTSLGKTKKESLALLEATKSLSAVFERKTTEEVQTFLDNFLKEPVKTSDTEVSKYGGTSAETEEESDDIVEQSYNELLESDD